MKEIKSILKFYQNFGESTERAAIAQVVRVEESSYRREGARMLVFESGVFEGGISGGCLEGDALKRSQLAIVKQTPSVVTYDTSKDDENQIGVGLGCNGVIDVLITPITENNKIIPLLQRCVAERKAHGIVSITHISDSGKGVQLGDMFYLDLEKRQLEGCTHASLEAFVLQHLDGLLKKNRSRMLDFEADGLVAKVFVELLPAQYHLVLYGDNYDVYPMLELAKAMDWEVSLVGNLQKLKRQRLQNVNNLYLKEGSDRPTIDDRTAVVLMAHDFKTDKGNLAALVKSSAPYIAVLGPKKRFKKMCDQYREAGWELTESELERIYAPCGLEIGANTPEEIAASIVAEILTAFSGKKGGMLRHKQGPIHERD